MWYNQSMYQNKPSAGFSLIEILITIAVIGILTSLILVAVSGSRNKGHDTRIHNDVSQLRYLAESIYDTQGASYAKWSAHPSIATNLAVLLEDIDQNYGDAAGAPYVTLIRDSQGAEYCVSAPLRGKVGQYYCIDSTGVFKEGPTPCPDYGAGDPPLRCPGN